MNGALIDHLWQSTLFCAAVWLITLTLRANSASLRHGLWLIASMKFLVPFSVLYRMGAAAGLPAPADAQPTLFTNALEVTAPMVSPTASLLPLASAAAPSWSSLFAAVWAAGSALLAWRWFRGWRAADSLARAARPAPGSSQDTRVTDAAIEPSVARVFRPVVLLPSALLGRLAGHQLDAVLAHERAHIRRHDNLTARLHDLVEIIFWFHPAVWWIGRRMLVEREQACDEAVLAQGHDPAQYAEGILAVCRHCHDLAHAPATSSALSGDLTRRVRSIIRHVPPASPGFCKTVALSAGTLAFIVTLMFAGAADRARELRTQIEQDSRTLQSAVIHVSLAAPAATKGARLEADGSSVRIRNTTLRELVAMSYDVDIVRMNVTDTRLDAARYDIEVRAPSAMSDAKRFDPLALQGVVNKLVASRFDLEIYVNQRCQDPCGRRARATASQTS